MKIFLIRHAESIANIDENYVKRLPDLIVPLTDNGLKQAEKNAQWIYEYCKKYKIDLNSSIVYCSPCVRARETSRIFNKYLKIKNIVEDITLVEQQYGMFDALPKEKWAENFPQEYNEYVRQTSNKGSFFARLPLGESPYDVAIRINQFFDKIVKENKENGIDNFFIFTHGTTIRAFLLRWFNYSPEWYHEQKKPGNCWIREIDGDKDLGYINICEEKKYE